MRGSSGGLPRQFCGWLRIGVRLTDPAHGLSSVLGWLLGGKPAGHDDLLAGLVVSSVRLSTEPGQLQLRRREAMEPV